MVTVATAPHPLGDHPPVLAWRAPPHMADPPGAASPAKGAKRARLHSQKQSLSFILNDDAADHQSAGPPPAAAPTSSSPTSSSSASSSASSGSSGRGSRSSASSGDGGGAGGAGSSAGGAAVGAASLALRKRRKRRASVPCETCGRVFGEAAALRKHQKVVHEQRKDFKCDVCGRAFAEKSNLKKHAQARHGTASNPHPCTYCGKEFNFSDGLRRHVNNCHLGLRPYVCDVDGCGAAFKQRTHLQKHLMRVNHGRPASADGSPSA
jgi:uncharacterized Zn-finger protein